MENNTKYYTFVGKNPDKLSNMGFYKPHKKGPWVATNGECPEGDHIEINFKTKEVIWERNCVICEDVLDMIIDTLLEENLIIEK